MILFISSFEIVNLICFGKSEGRVQDPKMFFLIAASVADVGAVNPYGIKALLGNGLSTFFIKGIPVFSSGPT